MKFMVGVMVLVGIIIIAMGLPAILDGLVDFRTEGITDQYIITTNGSTTTGDVQLTHALYNGDTQYASVSSNTTADVPVKGNYTSATKGLTFSGLAINTTRTISVNYRSFGLDNYTGADTGIGFFPVMLALSMLGIVGAAIAYVWKG